MALTDTGLVRRAYEQQVAGMQDECRRAVRAAADALDAAREAVDAGRVPSSYHLRTLVREAAEAAEFGRAWAELERVSFMLPDETKGG